MIMANNTLEHLLNIESQAAALVIEAQAEADRRVRENGDKNHKVYDERYKAEIKSQEESLADEKNKINMQYQKELEAYRENILQLKIDQKSFSDLLNEYLV